MSPHRRTIDAMNARAKRKRETLEMLDGRVYFSDDNWATIWQARGMPNGSSHRKIIRKAEADKIRYLVLCQHSLGASPR